MVQRRLSAIADETIGWADSPLTVTLAPGAPDAQGVVIWRGQVNIPAEDQGDSPAVVGEFETLPAVAPPGIVAAAGRRRVYVDTVPVQ